MTVAGVSFVSYILAGILGRNGMGIIALPVGAVLMVLTLIVVKSATAKKAA